MRRGATVWAALLLAGQAPPPRILRPCDRCVLAAGPVTVVAQGSGALTLDGKPLAAASLAPGVVTATLEAGLGRHELALAGAKVQFFVGTSGAPAGWKPFRPHPPGAACQSCHAVEGGGWAFAGPGRCFACHDPRAFPEPHGHNAEVLGECQLCHSPHGSTEKFHLKMTRETACKLCHG